MKWNDSHEQYKNEFQAKGSNMSLARPKEEKSPTGSQPGVPPNDMDSQMPQSATILITPALNRILSALWILNL